VAAGCGVPHTLAIVSRRRQCPPWERHRVSRKVGLGLATGGGHLKATNLHRTSSQLAVPDSSKGWPVGARGAYAPGSSPSKRSCNPRLRCGAAKLSPQCPEPCCIIRCLPKPWACALLPIVLVGGTAGPPAEWHARGPHRSRHADLLGQLAALVGGGEAAPKPEFQELCSSIAKLPRAPPKHRILQVGPVRKMIATMSRGCKNECNLNGGCKNEPPGRTQADPSAIQS
jgi:hypothetical protein